MGVLTANGIHSLQIPNSSNHLMPRNWLETKSRKMQFLICSAEECGAYLQYKKQEKDPRMPKSLGERRLRYREWMSHLPLFPTP
mmetsp:Transcript_22700/g.49130  ORF Transcript_22700/g.49130 Transcript_22700/m.49130 type:complete len:84 (-) Transcript_22700:342-593(-)